VPDSATAFAVTSLPVPTLADANVALPAQLTTSPPNYDEAVVDALHALRLFADHPGARRTLATIQVLMDAVRQQSERPAHGAEERQR